MLIPVKCFTCGKVIADKYLIYQAEVIKRRSEAGIHPDKINYLDDDKIDKTIEGDVLDMLKLTNICCRRHMLTHVNIF
jgi:DNA-directed RNA polymerase subunit N (RpoN/RPB10)